MLHHAKSWARPAADARCLIHSVQNGQLVHDLPSQLFGQLCRQRDNEITGAVRRFGTRSTVVTSQLPIEHWHQWLNDPTLADAILDRLVHQAHKITLKGESMRKRAADANNKSAS